MLLTTHQLKIGYKIRRINIISDKKVLVGNCYLYVLEAFRINQKCGSHVCIIMTLSSLSEYIFNQESR